MSYDENSLPSINEEDDSRAESNTPKGHIKKRSITNCRFEFQPDIQIEAPTPNKRKDKDDTQSCEQTKNRFVRSISSTTSGLKPTGKKCELKKSDTKTSKWSGNVKSNSKMFKGSCRSKTIDRQFTLSSSISSIR